MRFCWLVLHAFSGLCSQYTCGILLTHGSVCPVTHGSVLLSSRTNIKQLLFIWAWSFHGVWPHSWNCMNCSWQLLEPISRHLLVVLLGINYVATSISWFIPSGSHHRAATQDAHSARTVICGDLCRYVQRKSHHVFVIDFIWFCIVCTAVPIRLFSSEVSLIGTRRLRCSVRTQDKWDSVGPWLRLPGDPW